MNNSHDIQDQYTTSSVDVYEKIKIESSTTKVDSINTKKSRRRVQFQKVECTYHISSIHIDDFTDDEFEACWYSPDDFLQFRIDDKKLMRTYRGLIKQKRQASDSDMIDSLDEQIEDMVDEVRGLEGYASLQAHTEYKQRRIMYRDAVMKEQMRQKTLSILSNTLADEDDEWSGPFVLDAIAMRECVISFSMKSKLISYKLGLSDARFVRQMNNTDDSDSVTIMSSSSDESEQSQHIRTILEANEHQIIRIPPPCHDLNETLHSPRSQQRSTTGRVTASSILRRHQLPYLAVSPASTKSCVTCV